MANFRNIRGVDNMAKSKKKNLTLSQYGLTITTKHRIEIFFEVDDESDLERQLVSLMTGQIPGDGDDTDWDFTPGSPAYSPHITIDGSSKRMVSTRALVLVGFLLDEGAVLQA